jgi:Arc/MetJ-type ribon-helix-helix transcriptional regulator
MTTDADGNDDDYGTFLNDLIEPFSASHDADIAIEGILAEPEPVPRADAMSALASVAAQIEADCENIMSRLFTLYDIGKALPHPYDAIGDEARQLLHDFPSMSSRIRAYVKATESREDVQAEAWNAALDQVEVGILPDEGEPMDETMTNARRIIAALRKTTPLVSPLVIP